MYKGIEMVKSTDIARGRQEFEEERIRRVVRRHEAERWTVAPKNKALPWESILGFLAGWSVMRLIDKDRHQ